MLPYSCRNGTCASCRCTLVEGRIRYPHKPPLALDVADITAGAMLACQAVACSEIRIDAVEIAQVAEIPVRRFPARVEEITELTANIRQLRFKLPRDMRLQFLAGQYLDVILPDGKRRAFSIASSPSQTDFLELHVKHVEGGGFTGHVFHDMRRGELVRFEGPLGTFFVRLDSPRPIIMMGGGTGFAPLKAMIEDLIHAGDSRPLHLYWGARTAEDLYALRLIAAFGAQHPAFRFTSVLSEPGSDWTGRHGLVHQAVLEDHRDLDAHELYMSGPPAMIEAARHAFLEHGLQPDHLHYDSFDFAPDVPTRA